MTDDSEARWSAAVRVLAVLLALVAVLAGLEAVAIRDLRSDLQARRTERPDTAAAAAGTSGSVDEVAQAVRALDAFYANSGDGLARPGGLCAGGTLDHASLAGYLAGAYLPARAAGQSVAASIEAMEAAVRRGSAFRSAHPYSASAPK